MLGCDDKTEYVGFWARLLATLIDLILVLLITWPLLIAIYGWAYLDLEKTGLIAGPAEFLISWVAPIFVTVALWVYKQATPGKMAVSARIADAKTGGPITLGKAIGRYFAYFVSAIPLGLGFAWIAFDGRKQGWHDKLAGTVVVH